MLLGGRPSLRFMKLEKRSPAIAAPATNAPTFHGSPSSAAASGVASSERATPRMVFVGPNGGRPSAKTVPPSSGRSRRVPSALLASTGAPLATTISRTSLAIKFKSKRAPFGRKVLPNRSVDPRAGQAQPPFARSAWKRTLAHGAWFGPILAAKCHHPTSNEHRSTQDSGRKRSARHRGRGVGRH